MIRIVVVDNDKTFSQKVEKMIQNFFDEINERFSVKRYSEENSLLDELATHRRYDIYFLNVEMPEIGGLELAQKVRSIDRDADIIFISAHEKYAVSSYKIGARYYILKAEYDSEIPVILRQIWQERKDNEINRYVIHNISYGKGLRLDDIVYLKREKKYVLFFCLDGNTYRERGSLDSVYCKLPYDRFVYINKGHVINLKNVTGWDGNVIKLDSGVELTASRRMNRAVKDAIAQYWEQTSVKLSYTMKESVVSKDNNA